MPFELLGYGFSGDNFAWLLSLAVPWAPAFATLVGVWWTQKTVREGWAATNEQALKREMVQADFSHKSALAQRRAEFAFEITRASIDELKTFRKDLCTGANQLIADDLEVSSRGRVLLYSTFTLLQGVLPQKHLTALSVMLKYMPEDLDSKNPESVDNSFMVLELESLQAKFINHHIAEYVAKTATGLDDMGELGPSLRRSIEQLEQFAEAYLADDIRVAVDEGNAYAAHLAAKKNQGKK